MDQRLFSARKRSDLLEQMAANPLDVLIIGGGITGAGIAWDASSRGLTVGLIEMNDFASGTSSKSTKLVHGGLRYLKQLEINLVREVGRERAILHRSAPHIVIPAPMLLPVYKGGTYGYWTSSIGLYIYDWLAGVKRKERRKMLSTQETLELEPLFKDEDLKGAGYYFEYQTDDARLTQEVLKTAHANGAIAVNYTQAKEFIYEGEKVVGVLVEDRLTNETKEIFAHKIVNAAGPWVDDVRRKDASIQGKRLLLTKGVHLVVDHKRLPVKQAAYFDTHDGRMIFVIPRGRKTYIGTTDTVYEANKEDIRTTTEDRDYLLQAVNRILPSVKLTAADVESSWAGVRPLIHEEGKSPSEVSRKDEIFLSQSGLITIAGGKLTGFRKMAQNVVDLVIRKSKPEVASKARPCQTDQLPISGGDYTGHPSYHAYAEQLQKLGLSLMLDSNTVNDLITLYGTNTLTIYDYFEQWLKQEHASKEALILKAEIQYAIDHEMTVTALDFLVRRTGLMYFDRRKAERIAGDVIDHMSQLLHWDEEEAAKQHNMVHAEITKCVPQKTEQICE